MRAVGGKYTSYNRYYKRSAVEQQRYYKTGKT